MLTNMDGDAIDVASDDRGASLTGSGEAENGEGEGQTAPQFRYFGVLALMLICVIFLIWAPAAYWSKAVALAIEGTALVLTIATSREREGVRRRRAIVASAAMVALVVLIALDLVSNAVIAAASLVITIGIPIALARGLLRLLREQGVTLQSVAGSLAIYLSTGLVFAWIIGFVVAVIAPTPFFAEQVKQGSTGITVYYSFTVLTTTGFGDYTPATSLGHTIAVIEMLTGQIYLVTVIGLIIGNFTSKPRAA